MISVHKHWFTWWWFYICVVVLVGTCTRSICSISSYLYLFDSPLLFAWSQLLLSSQVTTSPSHITPLVLFILFSSLDSHIFDSVFAWFRSMMLNAPSSHIWWMNWCINWCITCVPIAFRTPHGGLSILLSQCSARITSTQLRVVGCYTPNGVTVLHQEASCQMRPSARIGHAASTGLSSSPILFGDLAL